MDTTIRAHFDGTYFVPDDPVVGLAPGDHVSVVCVGRRAKSPSSATDDPLLGMIELAVDTGIPDLSENADHYLYGHPKRTETNDD
jgi:hypothetical protein